MNIPEHDFGAALTQLISECDAETSEIEFTPEQRSIRIHGHSTTLRLEAAFWSKLEIIASATGMSVPGLISQIQDHCPQMDTRNLASCLRVFCLKFETIAK